MAVCKSPFDSLMCARWAWSSAVRAVDGSGGVVFVFAFAFLAPRRRELRGAIERRLQYCGVVRGEGVGNNTCFTPPPANT